MTKVLNAGVIGIGVVSVLMGLQAYFMPREGHQASLVSLIAAGSIGLLFIGSYLLWTKNPRAGRIMSALLCVACLGRFAPKAATGFYPNGLMTVLAGLLLGLLIAGHVVAKKQKA